jgi:hypothetical protein
VATNSCQSAAAIRYYLRKNEAIRDKTADGGEREAGTYAIKLDIIKNVFIFLSFDATALSGPGPLHSRGF